MSTLVVAVVTALGVCVWPGCGGDGSGAGGLDAATDAGETGDVVTQCPPAQPAGDVPCAGDLACTYGTECCGQCYPSVRCTCASGRFACGDTDACLGVADLCGYAAGPGEPLTCSADAQCVMYCAGYGENCCDRGSGQCRACPASDGGADARDAADGG